MVDVTCQKCGTVPLDSCPVEEIEQDCTIYNTTNVLHVQQRHSCGAPLIANYSASDYLEFDPICVCKHE